MRLMIDAVWRCVFVFDVGDDLRITAEFASANPLKRRKIRLCDGPVPIEILPFLRIGKPRLGWF